MAIKKLVPASHPILTKKAQAVKTFDDSLKRLLQDLEDTMCTRSCWLMCTSN